MRRDCSNRGRASSGLPRRTNARAIASRVQQDDTLNYFFLPAEGTATPPQNPAGSGVPGSASASFDRNLLAAGRIVVPVAHTPPHSVFAVLYRVPEADAGYTSAA